MNNQRLKYGDTIIISSRDLANTYYLSARSQYEQLVKVVYENRELNKEVYNLDLSLYP